MAKLVTVECGEFEPLSEADDTWGTIDITEKTKLIIDGNDITTVDDDGWTHEYKNYSLKLYEDSNYQEHPLFKRDIFIIKLRSILCGMRNSVKGRYNRVECFFRRTFQTIFRKSHISDYDLMDLDAYFAKRIIPKIKAYRENYMKRQVREYPPLLFQDTPSIGVPLVFSKGEMSDEEKAWVAVMDEIIFAMRWLLEAANRGDTPDKIAFFKEYYGEYVTFDDDEDRHRYNKQDSDAEKRAQKGFEAFGKFFSSFWY